MSSSGKKNVVSLPSHSTISKLRGTSYDVRQVDSIYILLVDQPTLRGLYRLTFANGDAYVGQSVNVASRFTSHRRRWEDITQFEFFPIPSGDLNQPEKDLIHLTEANGNVRNIAEAHKPLGDSPLELEVTEGLGIVLPWERENRTRPGDEAVSKARTNFFSLAQHQCYYDLRYLAGWYLYNTVPDPFNTQQHLWVSTALPSTGRTKTQRRLLTLSVGILEGFWAYEYDDTPDEPEQMIYINTVPLPGAADSLSSPDDYWFVRESDYKYGETFTWGFPMGNLLGIITGQLEFPHLEELIESSYQLNVRLMRQNAGGVFRRFHNELLANDLLASSLQFIES